MDEPVYIVVKTDKSQADTVSRLMTQIVDQLKEDSRKAQHHKDGKESVSLAEISSDNSAPSHLREKDATKNHPIEIIFPGHSKSVKAAITAETCIDANGQAKAKVLVRTEQEAEECKKPCVKLLPVRDEKKIECQPRAAYCELVQDYPCKKRNGLDPTHAELRGMKKFEYVPRKSKIPDYDEKVKVARKTIALSDHLSDTSSALKLCDFKSRRNSPIIAGLRQDCAKSIPEERLIKYKACVNRRNGLQDKCDPLTRDVLKKCCKANK